MENLAKKDIKFIHGVGPKRAELLEKQLGIRTWYDLINYFPFRYIDRSKIHKISEINGEMPYIQLVGKFISFTPIGEGARRRLSALFSDGSGTIEVVWFNRVRYIQETYRTGVEYMIFGKPTLYKGRWNISHPEVEKYNPDAPERGFIGVYATTETLRNRGMASRAIQRAIESLIAVLPSVSETLPEQMLSRVGLMPIREALINVHQPQSVEALQRARYRLKFEELFYLQLNIIKYVKSRNQKIAGFRFTKVGDTFNNFYYNALPFELTGAQKRVIREIRADTGSGRQMNRLLQGDVGSGKTLVALMSMLLAIDNGYQAAIMAPTEILATQHYQTISELCDKIGVRVELLTGSTRKKNREEIHEGLMSGEVKILIGTHALIEDTVKFANLGLVVIDEQHRFGVAQRAKLWHKNSTPPHVLVMTATPIPRTLAMTVYGDLDVSVIDELPPGRKPVQTLLRYDNRRGEVMRFVGSELAQGHQVYIVYPLIEESEKLDLRNVEEGYEIICETFPSYRVCMVHGRMKATEKEYQMKLFVEGQARIMVATTVIEVGVNVPNASVMVIENAGRFGLSQLHQLRGRVGRGVDQSFCILMSDVKISSETRHRLEVMTKTSDGFVIAEEDMRMRGPGDMEGTQQSGIAFNLRITDIAHDGQIIQYARDLAKAVIDDDPLLSKPQNARLASHLNFLYNRQENWSLIS